MESRLRAVISVQDFVEHHGLILFCIGLMTFPAPSAKTKCLRPLSFEATNTMQATTNAPRIAEEPTVPSPKPPCSWVLVRRSPTVAPKGRVNTKAAQNNVVFEIREK